MRLQVESVAAVTMLVTHHQDAHTENPNRPLACKADDVCRLIGLRVSMSELSNVQHGLWELLLIYSGRANPFYRSPILRTLAWCASAST